MVPGTLRTQTRTISGGGGRGRKVDRRGPVVASAASRGVAQPGSAPGWGPGGRRFKSSRPDSRGGDPQDDTPRMAPQRHHHSAARRAAAPDLVPRRRRRAHLHPGGHLLRRHRGDRLRRRQARALPRRRVQLRSHRRPVRRPPAHGGRPHRAHHLRPVRMAGADDHPRAGRHRHRRVRAARRSGRRAARRHGGEDQLRARDVRGRILAPAGYPAGWTSCSGSRSPSRSSRS